MLTLTCRTSGQPALVNPLRLSSIVPHPDGPGSMIRTMEGVWVPVFETTSEIADMLQPTPEPAGAPEPDAVDRAARLIVALAHNRHREADEILGVRGDSWEDTLSAIDDLVALLLGRR